MVSAGADPSRLISLAGPRGWGLPFTWDTFGHGHPNPPGTAYACTTALSIEALIDAGSADEGTVDIARSWGDCWTDSWYWYSESPCDAIYTPNAVALLAGATARLSRDDAIRARADAAVERLIETRDGLHWRYASDRTAHNCLIHDAFVLWGIETYRTAGGSVPVPWTPQEARTLAGGTLGRREVDRRGPGDALRPRSAVRGRRRRPVRPPGRSGERAGCRVRHLRPKPRMSVWFVTPAWRRYELSAVCFDQRAAVIKTLAAAGIEAHCVVIADDGNLALGTEARVPRRRAGQQVAGP